MGRLLVTMLPESWIEFHKELARHHKPLYKHLQALENAGGTDEVVAYLNIVLGCEVNHGESLERAGTIFRNALLRKSGAILLPDMSVVRPWEKEFKQGEREPKHKWKGKPYKRYRKAKKGTES